MTQRAKAEEPAEAAQAGQAPEHKVHYGRVDVAVWRRQAEDGRAWYSFSVSRTYKDRDDKWQRTASLDEEDLLPAAKAMERPTTGSRSNGRPPVTPASRTSAVRPPRDPSGEWRPRVGAGGDVDLSWSPPAAHALVRPMRAFVCEVDHQGLRRFLPEDFLPAEELAGRARPGRRTTAVVWALLEEPDAEDVRTEVGAGRHHERATCCGTGRSKSCPSPRPCPTPPARIPWPSSSPSRRAAPRGPCQIAP